MIDLEPLVTIGIPTYNRANKYLTHALQSALNQTYDNIEIIVADNCSTDNTEAVVNRFVDERDERIQYFKHPKNIGANNNFNFLVNQAHGHYFLLLHDDDLIDNDFIETCIKAANFSTDIGIIRTGTGIIDASGSVINRRPNMAQGLSTEDFFLAWFEGKTALFLCSTLFNTKRLKEIGGFQSKRHLFQDVIAEVRLAAMFGRADVQDVKASFRKHPDVTTVTSAVISWCEDSLMLLDIMCGLASTKREAVRDQGMRFFARLNYRRAAVIKPLIKRLLTYVFVFRIFRYCCLPPAKLIFPISLSLLSNRSSRNNSS